MILKKIEKSLNEKAIVLKDFDNDILELIDEADADTLLTGIQDSSNLSDEINKTLIKNQTYVKKHLSYSIFIYSPWSYAGFRKQCH